VPSPTLIAEATRRSGVVWVSGALLWHVWHDGAMYVLGGEGEQDLPVGPGERAVVTVRSKASQSGVVVQWPAAVEAVLPGSELWDEVVPLLAVERLNAAADDPQPERWASQCTVLRFVPDQG
jgi:hypothetical protein